MKTFLLLLGITCVLATSPGQFDLPISSFYNPAVSKADALNFDREFNRPSFGEHINEENESESEEQFQIPMRQCREVITQFTDSVDYSELSIDELIQIASKHEGLEFLADANATAAMGIDINNLHPDLVADALATTVRQFLFCLV